MPKRHYRAWLKIKGGVDRYGSDTFATQREALRDACTIIEEVRQPGSGVEWAWEIETYGSVREE
jgi:hypothetical protein